jgi:hypothetical protein
MKVKIQNGNLETTLNFNNKDEYEDMKIAIYNCLQYEETYKTITYNDEYDTIVFSATYLKNSLITYPKNR